MSCPQTSQPVIVGLPNHQTGFAGGVYKSHSHPVPSGTPNRWPYLPLDLLLLYGDTPTAMLLLMLLPQGTSHTKGRRSSLLATRNYLLPNLGERTTFWRWIPTEPGKPGAAALSSPTLGFFTSFINPKLCGTHQHNQVSDELRKPFSWPKGVGSSGSTIQTFALKPTSMGIMRLTSTRARSGTQLVVEFRAPRT